MNGDFEFLLKELDNYDMKGNKIKRLITYKPTYVEEYICCEDMIHEVYHNQQTKVCINCGLVSSYQEHINQNTRLNNKYNLSTTVSTFNNKYKTLNKLNNWFNYDYKENTLMKSCDEIEKICKNFNLNKIIKKAKFLYKNIYIDNNITSRNKIKNALYIYSIYLICKKNNIEIDLDDLLVYSNIKLNHFMKAISKLKTIEDEYKISKYDYFPNNKLKNMYQEIVSKGYKLNKKIVLETYYNLYENRVDMKLNITSINIASIYSSMNLLKDKEFINLFKSTKYSKIKIEKLIK